MHKQQGIILIPILVVLTLAATGLASYRYYQAKSNDIRPQQLASSSSTLSSTQVLKDNTDFINLDGTNVIYRDAREGWLGTGTNVSRSLLGLSFYGNPIPQDAEIMKAKLEFSSSKDQWLETSFTINGIKNSNFTTFSANTGLTSLDTTSESQSYSENKEWKKDKDYSYDVTEVVYELMQGGKTGEHLSFLINGTGKQFGRKYIYTSGSKSPKLVIEYRVPTITPVPTPTPTSTPTPTPRPTATPVPTVTPRPSITPTPTTVGQIWGVVNTSILGDCSANVHDRYVVNGGDGWLYRTWHPQVVPLNANSPNGARCTFAHEHGDNPAAQTNFQISSSPVRFGYIGKRHKSDPEPDGHQEPHEGFKVFIGNRGNINKEGKTNLHDSRIVFHMGTGGARRFDTRFHSMEYRVLTNDNRKMFVQAMADTGSVGNICATPRQGRTVMTTGTDCMLDSEYEIWENKIRIRNANNSVIAVAITSSAVFDPITVMDSANHSRVVYTWSQEAAQTFKFQHDRSNVRGCIREAYHGPTYWYNTGGNEVYYTDAMGMEMHGGELRQEISRNGYVDFIATTDGLAQFRSDGNYCAAGLGLLN